MPTNMYSNEASNYNNKFGNTILQIMEEIQERRHWIGADSIDLDSEKEDGPSDTDATTPRTTLRLLDYACGTGLVSRVRLPSSSPLRDAANTQAGISTLRNPMHRDRHL